MGEMDKKFEKVLEEISAVKIVLDDFSRAIFGVFGEIKTVLNELRSMLNEIYRALGGMSVLITKMDEALSVVKRLEELSGGRFEELVSAKKGIAPVQPTLPVEREITVKSFGVRLSPAFSQVVELVERNQPAEAIANALEVARDQLQSRVHGPIFYEISQFIKQLRMSGQAKLDIKTAEELMRKLEEWSERIKK
ncbi:MAG: hypothetical protein QXX87_05715 [Candidatus Jordarchaeales archaeon]